MSETFRHFRHTYCGICFEFYTATDPETKDPFIWISPSSKEYGVSEVVFPEQIDGIPVKGIYGDATPSGFEAGIKKLIIPDSVTAIRECSFRIYDDLEHVVFGENSELTYLGRRAFEGCCSLKEFSFPDGVANLYDRTFWGCVNIEKLHFGKSLKQYTDIARYRDLDNRVLKELSVSEENAEMYSEGNCVFSKSDNSLILGCGRSVIPEREEIRNIEPCAFRNIDFEEGFKIPDNIHIIQGSAFEGATGLCNTFIPKSVRTISSWAFSESDIAALNGGGLTTMGEKAFLRCKHLKKADFGGSGLTKIPSNTFFDCENLSDLTLPDKLSSIDIVAFANCKSLESVSFPESLKEIGTGSFSECVNLKNIKGFEKTGVKSVAKHAFRGCRSLKSFALPAALETIDSYAFAHTNIHEIILPENLTRIASFAFEDCKSLCTVVLPVHGPVKISETALSVCSGNTLNGLLVVVMPGLDTLNIDFVKNVKSNTTLLFGGDVHFAQFTQNKFKLADPSKTLVFIMSKKTSVLLEPLTVDGKSRGTYWDAAEEKSKRSIGKQYKIEYLPEKERSVDDDLEKAKRGHKPPEKESGIKAEEDIAI